MESLHSRIQSRISKRVFDIQTVTAAIIAAKLRRDYAESSSLKNVLKKLEQDQRLDKEIIQNVYWGLV